MRTVVALLLLVSDSTVVHGGDAPVHGQRFVGALPALNGSPSRVSGGFEWADGERHLLRLWLTLA